MTILSSYKFERRSNENGGRTQYTLEALSTRIMQNQNVNVNALK